MEAVSAMKRTPQKTMMSASVLDARMLSSSESPQRSAISWISGGLIVVRQNNRRFVSSASCLILFYVFHYSHRLIFPGFHFHYFRAFRWLKMKQGGIHTRFKGPDWRM